MIRARRTQLPGTVRPATVVIPDVLSQHSLQVSLDEDRYPVGELGFGRKHKSLGETVRPRTVRRDLHNFDTHVGQDSIERHGELAGPVTNEEPALVGAITEVHHQIPGLLSGPRPVRVRGRAEDVDLTTEFK